MKSILHLADSRGQASFGWLESYHTFSFGHYYNEERMGFGALRVINDDVISPSTGFKTHPHRDMEIVSIPLRGGLRHKDTIGNEYVIKKGEVQAMSAGTGISHSEFNNSSEDDANFLQIWVQPRQMNLEPSYSQKGFSEDQRKGKFQLVVSPDGRDNSVRINQDAFFSLIDLNAGDEVSYDKHIANNGVYFFSISGEVMIGSQSLGLRDGLGIEGANEFKIRASDRSELLVIEVPMK